MPTTLADRATSPRNRCRAVFALFVLASCVEPAPIEPSETSAVIRITQELQLEGSLLSFEAYCFALSPADVEPALEGTQDECDAWIEHEFVDDRVAARLARCTAEPLAQPCYRIAYQPNVCPTNSSSGYELTFERAFAAPTAKRSTGFVECVVR